MAKLEFEPTAFKDWGRDVSELGLISETKTTEFFQGLRRAETGQLFSETEAVITIILLGASGGGKSQLLNALAGRKIAKSHHLRPTTTRPTLYYHRDLDRSKLMEYGGALRTLSDEENNVVVHDQDQLRNKIIIDAPDIDSYVTEHRELVLELLPAVDLALYVVTPFSYKDDIGWSLMMREKRHRGFAFVINKWDAEGKPFVGEGRADVDSDFLQLIEKKAGFCNPKLFRVSAQWWAADEAERQDLASPAAGENFSELKEWIENGLSARPAEQLIRHRKRSLWSMLMYQITNIMPPVVDQKAVAITVEKKLVSVRKGVMNYVEPHILGKALTISESFDKAAFPGMGGPFTSLVKGTIGLFRRGQEKRVRNELKVLSDSDLYNVSALETNISDFVYRRLDTLDSEMSGYHFILPDSNGFQKRLPVSLIDRLHTAGVEAEALGYSRWQIWSGRAIFILGEVLLLGILGLAGWRLAVGYLTGDYLNLTFLWNFALLMICVLIVGATLIGVIFPPRRVKVEKHIRSEISRELEKIEEDYLASVKSRLDYVADIRKRGEALIKVCEERIDRYNRELSQTEDREIERLFSEDALLADKKTVNFEK